MKLKVQEEKENEVIVEIEGEEHSFPALVAWALLQDPNVEFAVYDKEHPLVGHARLYVKTKRGSPWNAMTKAVDTIEREFEDLLKLTESKISNAKTDKKSKKSKKDKKKK